MESIPALDVLRSVLRGFARKRGTTVYDTILALGFELLDPLENWDYHCTPVNSVAFGATGGDGIHLNLLTTGPGAGAVVLTVPPGEVPNIVLGESLTSFLRLGYHSCFGWLEVLAFDIRAGETEYVESPKLPDATRRLRDELRATFHLSPIEGITAHLAALQEKYLPYIELPNRAEWERRHDI